MGRLVRRAGVGDISGDGKADLVERDPSGNPNRNDGNGKDSFGSRAEIATGRQGYKGVFRPAPFPSRSRPLDPATTGAIPP
ncbi:hypothetical protein [Streptomyces sp. NPDC002164]|uniref:hypothetical protein n=1 Tax=unclassified Streptomyces TaxID=2593676 RepID=UPI0036A74BDE